jgi:hypothetical protein
LGSHTLKVPWIWLSVISFLLETCSRWLLKDLEFRADMACLQLSCIQCALSVLFPEQLESFNILGE